MTTTIAINCGCGFRVTNSGELASNVTTGRVHTAAQAMEEANLHCSSTGHTMEILGTVQP